MNETTIKAKVKAILEDNGWVVIRIRMAEGAGWPDLIAVNSNKRILFIETKTPTGIVSQIQSVRHKMLRTLGHTVLVINNAKEINKHL